MPDTTRLVLAAPIVGLVVALLTRRRAPSKPPAGSRAKPVVVQRSADAARALLADGSPVPAGAVATVSRGVYTVSNVAEVTASPALVTLGRVGEDDLLVDVAQAGVVALTGDHVAVTRTLRSVWSELRWPAESHELEVAGVGLEDLSGLTTMPWSHALTMIERGDERSRPLVVLGGHAPVGDDAVRLRSAAQPGGNVGVLIAGEWDGPWCLHHRSERAVLQPLGIEFSPHYYSGHADVSLPTSTAGQPASSDGVSVSVLGSVEVHGRTLSAKETELVAFLALSPNGVTEAQVRTALWPDRDAPRGTFNNLVSATRRQLGVTADGELLLPRVANGRYRLHPTVVCDLTRLEGALTAGDTDLLSDCLLGLTGRPFDGWVGADWPFDDAVVARAEVLVTRAAASLRVCDGERAALAVANALRAVPDDATLRAVI